MTDAERDKLLQEMGQDIKNLTNLVSKSQSVLFDQNGNQGLCSKVEAQGKAITRLWLVFALIVPSSGGAGFAVAMRLLGG